MILGTAGHVDHGKTALVKALTGVDTDRLPEEKRRGITLELGFAHLDLPSGERLGVIDVPGHERFVKAMAAGAGGVDLALLVVAADEGVMPQTREHVDVCRLLGVRAGLVVITKADLLPGLGEGWLELLLLDVRALVAGTCFEAAPPLLVSVRTGQSLEALKGEVVRQCAQLRAAGREGDEGPLFLPLDRAFLTKGFGLVVTGTVLSGRVRPGDAVSLVPGLDGPWRVRSLQVHGVAATEAGAGTRVALNLPELDPTRVRRGQAVVVHGQLGAARALDVEVTLLPTAERLLLARSRQLVCLGTAQVETALRLLDVAALRPGERCFGQLRFAQGVAALPGQRFILRGTQALVGRGATLGGGRVLGLSAVRRRRGAGARLEALASAPLDGRLRWLLVEAGYAGLTEPELFVRASTSPKALTRALELLGSRGEVVLVDREARRFLDAQVLEAMAQRALQLLQALHHAQPEREGEPREALRRRLGVPHERTFARVLNGLVEAGRVELVGQLLRLPGLGRTFDEQARQLKQAVLEALERAGLAPLLPADLAARLQAPEARVRQLLEVLVSEGAAVHAGALYFAAGAVRELEGRLVAWFATHERLTTAAFKDLVGQSRKFFIPLAEYFDREKLTLRVGDERTLRRRSGA
jgi:selenocysteine-specific elongation factor